jgi:hypothetical protein
MQKNMQAENMRMPYGQVNGWWGGEAPHVRTSAKNAIKLHPALGPEKTGMELAAQMRLETVRYMNRSTQNFSL